MIKQPIRVAAESRRHPAENLALRFPRLLLTFNRGWLRLPPRSPIRRRLIYRAVRSAIEAANRRDYEVAFALCHPRFEMNPPGSMVTLGTFPASVRGREERERLEGQWREEWGDFRYEPEELLDLGDRVLVLGRMVGSGPSSGAAFNIEWSDLFTLSRGQVTREQVFYSRNEALAAAGLGGRATSDAANRRD